MAINISKFIDERIDHYIKNSDYVDLSFQRELIRESVRFFLWTHAARSATERFYLGCLGQFSTERLVWTGTETYLQDTRQDINPADFVAEHILGEDYKDFLLDFEKSNVYKDFQKTDRGVDLIDDVFLDATYYPMPNVHLDVGLGKTIVGVLTAVIIIEALLEVNKNVEELVKKNTVIPYTNQSNRFLNMTTKDFQINFAIIPAMKREIEKMIYKLNLEDKVNIHFLLNNSKTALEKDEFDPNANFSNLYFELFDKIGLVYIQWAYDKIVSMKDEEEGLKFIENTILQGYSCDVDEVEEREEMYQFGLDGEKSSLDELKASFWKHQQDMTAEYSTKYKLPLFIVDELASAKTFIYRNDQKMIKLFNPAFDECRFIGITGVGLSASQNTAIRPVRGHVTRLTEYYSVFSEKKDVMKELVEKGIYQESGFIYKNIYMNEAKMGKYEDYLQNLEEINQTLKTTIKQKQEGVKASITALKVAVNDFFENERKMEETGEYDDGQNIFMFNQNLQAMKQPILASCSTEDLKTMVEKKNKLMENIEQLKKEAFYSLNIHEVLSDKGLTDLRELKTLYLFDPSYKTHNPKAIPEFVKYLQDNEVDVWTVKNYNRDALDKVLAKRLEEYKKLQEVETSEEIKVDEGNIAIVGFIDEMGKGFNLQDFDAIVVMYANQCSFDDIYQALGRLDRLGSDSSKAKEAIFIHFLKDEAFFKKLIDKRSKLSHEIKIEDHITTRNINLDEIKGINNEISSQIMDINKFMEKTNIDELYKSHKSAKNKIKLTPEQLENYRINKDTLFEIVDEITKELEAQLSYLNNVVAGRHSEKDSGQNFLEALNAIQMTLQLD